MTSLSDTFSLYAELAIALVGFTGVAAAFAGRERTFRPTELTRLQGILGFSASVFSGCLAFYATTSFGVSEQTSQSVVAVTSLLVTVAVLAFVIPKAWRHQKDADSTAETWALGMVTTITTGLVVTLVVASTPWGSAGLIVAAFSIQLLVALWLFVRLLTRPN